ncbi:MAG: Veg family protein [Bacillota bacterium]
MAERAAIEAIRERLDSHLGERIKVRASEGRRKIFEREGVLERTYPSIFVVRFEDEESRHMSWSYIDVLTDTVEIRFDQATQDR